MCAVRDVYRGATLQGIQPSRAVHEHQVEVTAAAPICDPVARGDRDPAAPAGTEPAAPRESRYAVSRHGAHVCYDSRATAAAGDSFSSSDQHSSDQHQQWRLQLEWCATSAAAAAAAARQQQEPQS